MAATAAPGLTYAGVVTRAIALGIDALLANGILLIAAGMIGLLTTLIGGDLRPQWLVALIAAAGWAVAFTAYFAVCWSTTGQTPGLRLMRLRVVTARGERVHFVRALVRVVGLALAIVPLFAGFIPVLFDARRRGLHDFMAGTVVIYSTD